MILNSLNALYDRLASDPESGITPLKFAPQKVSFRVTLKKDGTIFSVTPVTNRNTNQKFSNEIVPEHGIRSGSKILPQFMCDKAAYCLGLNPETLSRDGCEDQFEAFKKFHLNAEKQINSEAFSTFCRFLEKWNSEEIENFNSNHPNALTNCINFGIFDIQGESAPIHECPEVQRWWKTQESEELPTGQCLLTGDIGPIARLHPKIKGFSSAASLVGVQKGSSYESYQLEQAYTAPTSPSAAFKYASALNWLIDGKGRAKHRFSIGDTSCVAWTDKKSAIEDILGLYFKEGSTPDTESQDPQTLSKLSVLLKTIQRGKQVLEDLGEDPDKTKFFILGIEQPNPGRYSIRFFMQSSVSDLVARLNKHHADIEIVRQYETSTTKGREQSKFPSSRELLNQTAVRLSTGKLDYKTIPPLIGGAFMRAILENTPYPEALYSAILRRIRADRDINYLRAAILKGTLTRNHKLTITKMLDPNNSDPAYLLGRLFATLEKTQTDALGDLNAGLRDKFYSSASSTPASVFPRILRTYQHWLGKLKGGHKVNRERLVQDILAQISSDGFPSNFNLKSQGVFALGYYHQRKDFFTKKSDSAPDTESSN
jgi:CRISPR-associated protein Csd1